MEAELRKYAVCVVVSAIQTETFFCSFAKDVQALQMGSSVSNKDITQLENNMEVRGL